MASKLCKTRTLKMEEKIMSRKFTKFIDYLIIIASILIILISVCNFLIDYKQSKDSYYSFQNLYEEYRNKNWDGSLIQNGRHFAMVTEERRSIMIDYNYQDEEGFYFQIDYPSPMASREYVIESDDNGTYIITPEDATLNYWSNGKLLNSWALPERNPSGAYYGYDVLLTEEGPFLSYNYVKLYKIEENELVFIADDIVMFNLKYNKRPSYTSQDGNVHDFTGQVDNTIYVPTGDEWVPFSDNIIQWEYYSLHSEWKNYEWDGEFKITDDGLCVRVTNDVLLVNGKPTSYFNYLYPIDYETFLDYMSWPYNICSYDYFISYEFDKPFLMRFEHGNFVDGAILPHDGKWKINGTVNFCQQLELLGSDEQYYYDPELGIVFRHEAA